MCTLGRKDLPVDSQSKRVREVLSVTPQNVGIGVTISRDDRQTYYSCHRRGGHLADDDRMKKSQMRICEKALHLASLVKPDAVLRR